MAACCGNKSSTEQLTTRGWVLQTVIPTGGGMFGLKSEGQAYRVRMRAARRQHEAPRLPECAKLRRQVAVERAQ